MPVSQSEQQQAAAEARAIAIKEAQELVEQGAREADFGKAAENNYPLQEEIAKILITSDALETVQGIGVRYMKLSAEKADGTTINATLDEVLKANEARRLQSLEGREESPAAEQEEINIEAQKLVAQIAPGAKEADFTGKLTSDKFDKYDLQEEVVKLLITDPRINTTLQQVDGIGITHMAMTVTNAEGKNINTTLAQVLEGNKEPAVSAQAEDVSLEGKGVQGEGPQARACRI